jgi:hypothetical protein
LLSRYPFIVETALRLREKLFVIDGEAVVLDVRGFSDFGALHSRKNDHEVQLYAFDLLSRIAQLDQRTALPDQCLLSAEADVRPPRRKSRFDPYKLSRLVSS